MLQSARLLLFVGEGDKTMQLIPIEQHPSAGHDPSSVLVNYREPYGRDIYRHRGGYLATFYSMAFPGLFPTEKAARDAQAAYAASDAGADVTQRFKEWLSCGWPLEQVSTREDA